MLHYLKVENLALMDYAALEFAAGFTAVTGETGAGKSVLLGALSILAGNRIDKSIIRQGQKECVVEAVLHFKDSARINSVLEEIGVPLCEAGQLLVRRVIHRDKPSRIHINGSMATLAALQQLGACWVDFHGPGEPQKLFQGSCQLELLDQYSGNRELRQAYEKTYGHWRGLLAQAETLKTGEALSPDEAAFIRTRVEAIDAVNPSHEAIVALERDYARIHKARELTELIELLQFGMAGEQGLMEKLPSLIHAAQTLAEIDPSAEALRQRLEALSIEIDDLALEFGHLGLGLVFDEAAIDSIQQRMEAWLSLKRQYGPSIEAVCAKREALWQRLESQSQVTEKLVELTVEVQQSEARLKSLSEALRVEREQGAQNLAKQTGPLLARLGFPKATFEITITREGELKAHGDSACQFLFAANAGQTLKPLHAIASSGEMARVMLALKAVLAAADSTPLLVFDEVDANVGGEIGVEVGRELARLAGAHQVLCVTHLPQVAVYGEGHFVVEKSQSREATTVSIDPVEASPEIRETEIARMLGDRKSASAQHHAKALLAKVSRETC